MAGCGVRVWAAVLVLPGHSSCCGRPAFCCATSAAFVASCSHSLWMSSDCVLLDPSPQAFTSPAWHLLSPKDPRHVCFGALFAILMLCGSQPVARRHPGMTSAAGSTAQQLGSSCLHRDLPLLAGWVVGCSLYLRLRLE